MNQTAASSNCQRDIAHGKPSLENGATALRCAYPLQS